MLIKQRISRSVISYEGKIKNKITLFFIILTATLLCGFSDVSYFTLNEAFSVTPLGLILNGTSAFEYVSSSCFVRSYSLDNLNYLSLFFLTFFIEGLVLYIFLKDIKRTIYISLILNIATHPLVTFIIPCIFSKFTIYLLFAESFAFLTEFIILYFLFGRSKLKKYFLISALMNITSWQIGPYIYYYLFL